MQEELQILMQLLGMQAALSEHCNAHSLDMLVGSGPKLQPGIECSNKEARACIVIQQLKYVDNFSRIIGFLYVL